MLGVLLRKQIIEKLSVFKQDKARLDILGNLLSLTLAASVIAIVVIVFAKFVKMYCLIRINNILDIPARQYELLTWIYSLIFIFGIFSGVKAINFAVFENDDQKILMALPIEAKTIFYSKLITIYSKQIFIFVAIILPLNLTFAAVTEQSAYYILMTLVMCLIFPLITLAFSSIFCLPAFYIKRFVQSKYSLLLIIVTAITGFIFWGYSAILDFMKTMLTTGELRFFFKESTMQVIIKGTKWLYPSNLMAAMLLKRNVCKNLILLISIAIIATAIGFLMVNLLFYKANHERASANKKYIFSVKSKLKQKPVMIALIKKEFNLIFRTPSYAFQYFSVAAIMPLMVYFCMGIGSDLLQTLVFSENNFELSIFIILLFSTLTNTFCATNISREGQAFYILKTMPISFSKILGAKILFCTIVSVVSILVSCIVVFACGYINFGEFVFVFFIAVLISEAQICFATRKDLNRPVFSNDEDCEVKESNSTISTIIITGLIIALLLGGLSLYFSVYNGSLKGGNSTAFTLIFVGLSAVALFSSAVAYLLIGLKKSFYELPEGK